VVPIPGASAALAAVMASGIAGPRWTFDGFLPRSGRDRRERLERLAADERGAIVYESPGRLLATLRDLARACGPARPAAICRELTKVHEQVVRGQLADLVAAAEEGSIPARGEVVIVVGEVNQAVARHESEGDPAATAGTDIATALAAVESLVADGIGRAAAARQVSAQTGVPRRQLYRVDRD